MARFEEKEFLLSEINGGEKYQNGDIPDAEAINAPIEASAYAQKAAKSALQKADEALNKVNDSSHGSVALSAYPIGSIYITASSISPAALFGGTWEQIKGRFLLASDENHYVGETGGSETHSHGAGDMIAGLAVKSGTMYLDVAYKDWESNWTHPNMSTGLQKTDTQTFGLNVMGDTDTQTILPPYLAVNVWKRVA